MTSYTEVFGGGTLDPAQPSYKAYTASTSIASVWPIESNVGSNVVAAINDISFTATDLTFTMPPSNEVGVGYNSVFNNVGSNAFTVLDNAGNVIVTASAGAIWSAYLTNNATASGAYNTFQAGAGTSSASPATLAGLGLKAITTTLNQEYPTGFSYSTNQTLGAAKRAAIVIWTGGAGTFTLDTLATLTAGWFVNITNQGSGALVIAVPSGSLDGGASKTLNPGDTAIIVTDATNTYSIGFGQDATFAFSFLEISLAGKSGTYTLSGAELNVTALRFTGALVGNLDVIVPSTVQQYWCDNETTGGFVFGVREVSQATPGVSIVSTARDILYCDATNVIRAETVGLSAPISIAEGGTSATSAANARTNLDVPSVGESEMTSYTYVQMFS